MALPAVVDWLMAFYEAAGKQPIRIKKEVPGHLINRLQMALWREVIYLVNEGVASVSDADKGIAYTEVDVMMKPGKRREMIERTGGNRKVPQIFVDGRHIGDCEDIQGLEGVGELDARLGIGE